METSDRSIKRIAWSAEVEVVFVIYTPTHRARFPVAVGKAYVIPRWIFGNGKAFNVGASRLNVAGDSVDSPMAAAVTLLFREIIGPNIQHPWSAP
jgi:acetyl esterase/lipase